MHTSRRKCSFCEKLVTTDKRHFVRKCSEAKQKHIATVVLIYCVVSNGQMKYHWDRKKLLSFFFLFCCHVSDLLLVSMRYVFTVVATSWLKYSRQLERMLLSVIARSVMLLRDSCISQHNLTFEATNVLLIFPVRNVRQRTTRGCLSWFHKNEPPKYIFLIGNCLVTYSKYKCGSVDKKTLYILETVLIRRASWLIEYRINFETLMSQLFLWRSCSAIALIFLLLLSL